MADQKFLSLKILEKDRRYLQALSEIKSTNVNKAMREYLRKVVGPMVVKDGRKNAAKEFTESSGRLARNMGSTTSVKSGLIVMKFGVFRGPARVYYPVQEFGTQGFNPDSPIETIFPRRKKALTIPNPEDPKAVRDGAPSYAGGLFGIYFRNSPKGPQKNIIGLLFPKDEVVGGTPLADIRVAYFLASHLDVKPKYMFFNALQKNLPKIRKLVANFAANILTKEANRDPKVRSVLRRYNL